MKNRWVYWLYPKLWLAHYFAFILSPEDGKEAEFDEPDSWTGVQSSTHENEDGSEDWTLVYTGFTQIPDKLTFATRLVKEGDYVRNYPILYKDEVTCS